MHGKIHTLLLLLLLPGFAPAQEAVRSPQKVENPFLEWATQVYSDYCDELETLELQVFDHVNSDHMKQITARMREAAKISGKRTWALEADFVTHYYSFCRSILTRKPDALQMNQLSEKLITNLQDMMAQAKKAGADDLYLRLTRKIFDIYRHYIKNYEKAFLWSIELDRALAGVSTAHFPLKPGYYSEIAALYGEFEQDETAVTYLNKILEDIAGTSDRQLLILYNTYNDLGLIYRYHYQNFEKSDSCFYHIIESIPADSASRLKIADEYTGLTQHDNDCLWKAVALGNIGCNRYLCGNYDEAIPLLDYAIEIVVKNNPYNYPYAASRAIDLTSIFLRRGDLKKANEYAGKIYLYLDLSRKYDKTEGVIRDTKLWMEYYEIRSRYWQAAGDNDKAWLYNDSVSMAAKMNKQEYSPLHLQRAEQTVRQQELEIDNLHKTALKRNFLFALGASLLLAITLGLILYFYRKRQIAYRELVQKNLQWAGEGKVPDKASTPSVMDITIMDAIRKRITRDKIYLRSDLTMDYFAQELDVSVAYISAAVNHCEQKRFNVYINEFRVKEAIHLLSQQANAGKSADEIAETAGFNDRKSFHRVFKKMTGLSPTDFRKNLQEKGSY